MVEQLLQQILEKLTQMDARISNMEIRISNMDARISNMEIRISNIEKTMATKEDVAEIPFIKKAVLEIDNRTIEMLENLKKHNRVLEVLSLRSIEHETDIRDIKRLSEFSRIQVKTSV